MCIGLPLRVIATTPGRAVCEGRGEVREVETALVGECEVGEWLLVFLGSARERIGAGRAAEVNAALDLLSATFDGDARSLDDHASNLGFALPSATSAEQLAAFAGHPAST
jgi:hydrogenase expression/formation protein HypC